MPPRIAQVGRGRHGGPALGYGYRKNPRTAHPVIPAKGANRTAPGGTRMAAAGWASQLFAETRPQGRGWARKTQQARVSR